MSDQKSENRNKIQRVTLVGMAVDIFLGVIKILVGLLAYSQALIADGVHSLSDALTDIFVIVITRIARADPDDDHPYGHARFETLGTVFLGITLIGIACVLGYTNLLGLLVGEISRIPAWPALLVAVLSIISKEWIFHYTRRAGEELRSKLLIANAWHSRTDAISSLIVLLGVFGAMAGFPWLDRFAAIIVALIVAKIGARLVLEGLAELVDTGLSTDDINEIRAAINAVPGVRDVHDLRTRKMGADVYLDVHLLVEPRISVSEGHQIGEWVDKKLLDEFDNIHDVTYHIDPEDDSNGSEQHYTLPLRQEVLAALKDVWSTLIPEDDLLKVQLHYLRNRISIELYLADGALPSLELTPAELQQQLNEEAKDISWFGGVRVWSGAK